MTKPTRHYTPGGKGHRILARLAESDGTLADLVDAIGRVRAGQEFNIARRVVGALTDEGYVCRNQQMVYRLLPAGRTAKARLDERAVGLPHARVFAREKEPTHG